MSSSPHATEGPNSDLSIMTSPSTGGLRYYIKSNSHPSSDTTESPDLSLESDYVDSSRSASGIGRLISLEGDLSTFSYGPPSPAHQELINPFPLSPAPISFPAVPPAGYSDNPASTALPTKIWDGLSVNSFASAGMNNDIATVDPAQMFARYPQQHDFASHPTIDLATFLLEEGQLNFLPDGNASAGGDDQILNYDNFLSPTASSTEALYGAAGPPTAKSPNTPYYIAKQDTTLQVDLAGNDAVRGPKKGRRVAVSSFNESRRGVVPAYKVVAVNRRLERLMHVNEGGGAISYWNNAAGATSPHTSRTFEAAQMKHGVPEVTLSSGPSPRLHSPTELLDLINQGVKQKVIRPDSIYNHAKPSGTFGELVYEALAAHPEQTMSVNGIYESMKMRYPYFQHASGWESSVRHALSHAKNVYRVVLDEKRKKQGLWTVDANHPRIDSKIKPKPVPRRRREGGSIFDISY
ncbi:hypothetical protein SeMB42_g03534 [Synchytrium endobioticum]|uniref:Fork-head domain-containing protein n=1 Tax=Synchytrium endobioticum TaxID=286115 RepID=A0A507DI96_9FUNG|nr:hypothetical protein SeMB42_g03534 [Synchytrium endobioticum]TPX51266.1 hypothetical protein SeLEV6574_g00369 [Synchytrium endobioticum]